MMKLFVSSHARGRIAGHTETVRHGPRGNELFSGCSCFAGNGSSTNQQTRPSCAD
jgi:hypothetical protein